MSIYANGGGSDWPKDAPRFSFYFSLQYDNADDYAQAYGLLYGVAHAALSDGREGSVKWEHRPIQANRAGELRTEHYLSVRVSIEPAATFKFGAMHRKRIAEGKKAAWLKLRIATLRAFDEMGKAS